MTTDIEQLTEYGTELATHGYEVWLTKTTWGGYLQYKDLTTGDWGSLQQTEWDGWQHLMPLIPSREFGSSMHLDTDTDPFTLKAARECARPFNSNAAVGGHRLPNAKNKTWRSASAIPLHAVSAV